MPSDDTNLVDDESQVIDGAAAETTTEPTPNVDDAATGTDANSGTDANTVPSATTDAADPGTAEPVADTANDWRAQYEELGFQDLETPEQAHQRLVESYRRERQRADQATEQAQYHQALVARLGQTNPTEAAAPSAPAPDDANETVFGRFTKKWVDVDRETIAEFVITDDDGNTTWKPNTPPELINQVHEAQKAQRKWNDVIQDPRQLEQAISQKVESLVGDRLNSALSERESMTAESTVEKQFLAENQWLYAVDPITNRPTNQPSPEGRVFGAHYQRAVELGIPTKAAQLEYAIALYQSSQRTANPAPVPGNQQQTQQVIDQRRREMLGQTNTRPAAPTTAAGITDGKGSQPAGESRMSFGQSVAAGMKENKIF